MESLVIEGLWILAKTAVDFGTFRVSAEAMWTLRAGVFPDWS